MDELVESLEEELKQKGYKYDFDHCGWYKEESVVKDGYGRAMRLFIPPFGITDKQLYERLSELKGEGKL